MEDLSPMRIRFVLSGVAALAAVGVTELQQLTSGH
jgi:hypothetical protein